MDTRATILEIPRFLRETLEKGGGGEYEKLVRQVRWGEGPVYICSCGASSPAGIAAGYLFEWLAGLPVLAGPPGVFEAYTVWAARPRSVVIVISSSGEDPQALEIARLARSHRLVPLALTRLADSPLAAACEGVILTREEGEGNGAAAAICQLGAISSIALQAAKLLRQPRAELESIAEELRQLPGQLEWSFTQLADALRSLAERLRAAGRLWLVGGGLYHAAVVRAAGRLDALPGMKAEGLEASQFYSDFLPCLGRGDTALFVSGGRLRLKRILHEAAAQVRLQGATLLALTDASDRGLTDRSDLAVLAPPQSEVGGSLLALALLELLAAQAARPRHPSG
jgi:fructoselysine-6-P-deglycase FrlB-like protein